MQEPGSSFDLSEQQWQDLTHADAALAKLVARVVWRSVKRELSIANGAHTIDLDRLRAEPRRDRSNLGSYDERRDDEPHLYFVHPEAGTNAFELGLAGMAPFGDFDAGSVAIDIAWLANLEAESFVCGHDRTTGNLASMADAHSLKRFHIFFAYEVEGSLASLANLVNLEELTLTDSDRRIRGDLGMLAGLERLRCLRLDGNTRIRGSLESLAGLTNLIDLSLCRGTAVRGSLDGLRGLLQLVTVELSDCADVEGSLDALRGLSQLKTLHLRHCTGIEGPLEAISDLTAMVSLGVPNTRIHGDLSALAKLKKLTVLDITDCPDIGGSVATLATLPALNRVGFMGAPLITGDVFEAFGKREAPMERLQVNASPDITGFRELVVTITGFQEEPQWQHLSDFQCEQAFEAQSRKRAEWQRGRQGGVVGGRRAQRPKPPPMRRGVM